jgi:hypothetical protein
MAGVGPGDLDLLAFDVLTASVAALDSIPGFAGLETLLGAPLRQATSPGPPPNDCEQITVHANVLTEANVSSWASRENLVQLVVTVYRCVPSPLSSMKAPKVASIERAAAQTNADAWALWNHLWNMIRAGCLLRRCRPVTMSARALPQQGGYGGWQLTLGAKLDGYEEAIVCEDEEEV